MEIIATLGVTCEGDILHQTIEECLRQDVNYFRFNFAKYDNNDDIYRRAYEIRMIQDMYNLKVMVDFPFPFKKPRIYVKSRKMVFQKGDTFNIYYGEKSMLNDVYTDSVHIGELGIGNTIIYADGQSIWKIKDKKDNYVQVEVQNACTLIGAKSINFEKVILCDRKSVYMDVLNIIHPKSAALSFISSSDSLVNLVQEIPAGVELISKIETDEGIRNIKEIVEFSNVMVARGDLRLYCDFYEMFNNQNIIVATAAAAQKKVYIATGVLSSLFDNCIPTPSDIIDITHIISLNPDGIILNYGVVKENLKSACEIFKYLKNNLNKK